ncbi:MAG: ABC transporter substrate-binding protein, partial [Chloroflexota bacterium]
LGCTLASPTPVPTAAPPSASAAEPTEAAPTPPTPAATPTPALASRPSGQRGGSLTVAAFADLEHRDVHQSVQEALISQGPGLAYSRLLRVRTGPEVEQPSLLLECDLCQGWKISEDLSFYEFQLRRGVHWQNLPPVNGRPLVASDLAYSYQRLHTPGWPHAVLLASSGIGSIEATDTYTLKVKLNFANSDALLSLADGHSKIVAREVVEQYGDLRDSPVVGTGPWVWEKAGPTLGTTLTRNREYFEDGLPLLERMAFRVIKGSTGPHSSDEEALAAFGAGLVDVLPIPPHQWRALGETGLKFDSFVSRQGGSGVLLSLNVQSPLLKDPVVRRAIFKAIDPWDQVDTIGAGQGYASVGILVPHPDWLLSRAEIRGQYFASPSEAREMLANRSTSPPVDIQLTVGDFGDLYRDLGQRVARDLRAVGFNPTLRQLNPEQYAQKVLGQHKEYQIALGASPPTSTPNSFLFGLLHSGRLNIIAHNDSTLDRMIEQQAVEFNPTQRQAQLREIQRYVLDQAYLFSPVTGGMRWVFNRKLQGFYPNTAASEYIYWSRAWLAQ